MPQRGAPTASIPSCYTKHLATICGASAHLRLADIRSALSASALVPDSQTRRRLADSQNTIHQLLVDAITEVCMVAVVPYISISYLASSFRPELSPGLDAPTTALRLSTYAASHGDTD